MIRQMRTISLLAVPLILIAAPANAWVYKTTCLPSRPLNRNVQDPSYEVLYDDINKVLVVNDFTRLTLYSVQQVEQKGMTHFVVEGTAPSGSVFALRLARRGGDHEATDDEFLRLENTRHGVLEAVTDHCSEN